MAWPEDMFGPPQPVEAIDAAPAAPWSWIPSEWDAPAAPPVEPPPAAAPEAAPPELVTPTPEMTRESPEWPPPHWLAAAEQSPPALGEALAPPPTAGQLFSTFEQAMAGDEQDELAQLKEDAPFPEPDFSKDLLANPDVDAAAQQYASMNPEQRVAYDAKRSETQRLEFANKQLEAAQDSARQLKLDQEAETEARARAQKAADEVNAEAVELANAKIDGDQWWSSRNVPQKIAGFLAAIVGGLVQGRRGGPNEGLAMIEREIDRDIDVQQANLAHRTNALGIKRGIVGEMFDRTNDAARAAATARVASWESVERQLLAEQQKFDPRGTMAQRIGQAVIGARQAKAAAHQAFAKESFKNQLELIKVDQEQQKINETARAAQVKERRAAAAAAAAAAKTKAENTKRDPSHYAGQGLVAPPIAMSEKEYNVWTGRREKQYEMGKEERAAAAKQAELAQERGISGETVAVKDKDGNTVGIENRPLTQKDGKPWIPSGSTAAVDKLRDQKVAADKLINVMDEVLTLGPEYLSDTANSAKLQQLKQLWADAKLETKNYKELGVIAGPDLNLIEDYLGTPDPTRYKSSVPGIKQARKSIVNGIRTKMQAHGFTGEFDPAPIGDAPKPKLTEAEQATKDLATTRGGESGGGFGGRGNSLLELAEGVGEFGMGAMASQSKRIGKSLADLPKAKASIQALGARARDGHIATRDQALADLLFLSQKANSEGVRIMAAEELQRISDPSAGYEVDEELSEPNTSETQRDTSSVGGKGK